MQKVEELIKRVREGRHTKEDLTIVAQTVKKAIKFMVDTDIVPIPENYRLWFYTFCKLIMEGKKDPSREEIMATLLDVSKTIGTEISLERLRALQERTREIISSSGEIIESTIANIEKYDKFLNGVSKRLEGTKTEEEILRLVELVLEEIKALRTENKAIRERLSLSTKQLNHLKEQMLRYVIWSSQDALTGVLNRSSFEKILRSKIENFNKTGEPFCLFMIDLDKFKEINDLYGHVAGDEALSQIANMIKKELRKPDVVARYGGDEFAVIVHAPIEEAVKVAERLLKRVNEQEVVIKGKIRFNPSMSIGVAEVCVGDTPKTLIERADMALYLAKREGGNRVRSELDLEKRGKE